LVEAEAAAQRAAALRPDLVEAHDLLSVIMERQQKPLESAAAGRRAAELMPQDSGRQYRLGLTMFHLGDFTAAEHAVRQAVLVAPKPPTFHNHHLLGIVLQRQGRAEEAVVEARRASDILPDNADLLGRVAETLMAAKSFEEAEATARQAIAMQPESASLQRLLAHIVGQRSAPAQPPSASPADPEAELSPEEQISRSWHERDLHPDDPARHLRVANLLIQSERYAEGEVVLSEAIELHGGVVALHDMLGVALERQKRHAEAAEAVRRATELAPDDAGRFGRLGGLYLAAGQFQEAEKAGRTAIGLREDVLSFHHVLGIALHRQQRTEEAVVAARRSVELAPSNPDLNAHLGVLLISLKQFPEAEQVLTLAVRESPEHAGFRRLLGYALEHQHRPEEEAEQQRKVAELEPDSIHERRHLANLLIRANKPAEAELVLKAAISRNAAVSSLHDDLSILLQNAGRIEEAAAALREAVALDGDNQRLRTRLGDLLGTAGNVEEAELVLESTTAANASSAVRLITLPVPATASGTSPPHQNSVTAQRDRSPRVSIKDGLMARLLRRTYRQVRDGRGSQRLPRTSAVALAPEDDSRLAIIAAAERITGVPARDLVMKFEPLGCDCELGMIQRACEAEPLSMLRFTFIPLEQVIRGVQTHFAGFVENLDAVKADGNDNWDLVDRAYHTFAHTFRLASAIDKETLLEQQRRRIAYLRDKLFDNLAEAEKIFVVWRWQENLTEEEATRLWEAMRARGPGRLLWIVKDAPAGVVQEIRPGFLRGTIDRWRIETDDSSQTFSLQGWLTVLANAWLLCRDPSPG
jgi:tetratricopeptide (TPR) repeat protein